ncbi:hypothetical protein BH18THE2_BH18THE2_32070 [soil metagenome]
MNWSEWLNFNKSTVENIPEEPGIQDACKHEELYIGSNSQNIRQSLLGCLSDPCISKATRFSYAMSDSADIVKEQLINEYRSKHNQAAPVYGRRAAVLTY